MKWPKKVLAWLRKQWNEPGQITEDARKIIIALHYVKAVLNSKATVKVVELIPGDIDNRIVEAIKKALDIVLEIPGFANTETRAPMGEKQVNAIISKTGSVALQQLHKIKECQADTRMALEYMKMKSGTH